MRQPLPLTNLNVGGGTFMCPACIASAVAIVAGTASTGAILAVCIGKFRKLLTTAGLGLIRKQRKNVYELAQR
jgi:hypothetical protein